jgi:hypothetical protein
MMNPFTLDDLISHSYEQIEAEGMEDIMPEKTSWIPGNDIINRIMGYSRALAVHHSGTLGHVSYVMN